MRIDPKFLTLHQLLAGRLFRIPEYQRAYSWTKKQRQDMFDDIEAVRGEDDKSHFMATVVGLAKLKRTIVTDDYQVVDIVDGQQRITTLVLLLKAIYLDLSDDDSVEGKLRQEIADLLVKADDHSLLLLQTNHDSNQYFANYIRRGVHPDPDRATTLADRSLLRAIADCREFVERWGNPVELVAVLKNRLTFIFHQIDDEGAVYTVFEVLNSRGLPVAWLDRLKSFLMAVAFENDDGNRDEVIQELHQVWTKIYRVVGLRQGMSAESLRFAATLRYPSRRSKVMGEEAAVDALREAAGSSPANALEISQWLLSVTGAVDTFLTESRRSRAATRIVHARLVAVAAVLQDLGDPRIREVLHEWERVSFRVFGLCRKDARSKVGDYVRLAWDIVNDGKSPDDIVAGLRRIGDDDEEHGIEWAELHTMDANCYEGWEEELRYLLFRYEEHLAEKNGIALSEDEWERIWQASPSRSIEHVLPQSHGSSKRSEKGVFVHRLGNLTLLPPGVNASLGDRDPEQKVERYQRTGLLVTRQVAEIIEREGWGRPQVEARERDMIDWIKETWS